MDGAISFLTVFLGLVLGPQSIDLAVSHEVAAVEVRLDGELLARLEGEPWTVDCDFGERLLPHRLVAVAFAEDGLEIGRSEQWINLPGPMADAGLVLDGRRPDVENGSFSTARLSWDSVLGTDPESIRVLFDGTLLEFDDPAAITLPPHDPDQLHFLRAELDFEANVSALAELTFGGFYADRVSSELTALPVRLDGRRRLPELAEMQDTILSPRGALPVVGSDKGPVDIVVVRDITAQQGLSRMFQRKASSYRQSGSPLGQVPTSDHMRQFLPLQGDARVFLLAAWPERRIASDGTHSNLFPSSPEIDAKDAGWLWLLSRVHYERGIASDQRLADAVAVAGMTAAQRNHRRAVLLVLGDKPAAKGQLWPRQVEEYLEQLRVPLVVWQVGESLTESQWSNVTLVDDLPALGRGLKRLERQVKSQRMLWVEGKWLPQELRLTSGVRGLAEVP